MHINNCEDVALVNYDQGNNAYSLDLISTRGAVSVVRCLDTYLMERRHEASDRS
jgi:hypothetical protein